MDTGKSYMIKQVSPGFNHDHGAVEVRQVYQTGDDIRQRLNYTTGVVGFKGRQIIAEQLGGKPVDAPQPYHIKHFNKSHYTPALTKIDGYVQHPRPVGKPYINKLDYTSEVKTHEYVPKQRNSVGLYHKV